jgi:hypothetical protein
MAAAAEEYTLGAPILPSRVYRDGEASSSSSIRLGKRALHHPPAVSELSYGSRSSSPSREVEKQEEQSKYPKGWKLAIITLALCCAVFVVTLV